MTTATERVAILINYFPAVVHAFTTYNTRYTRTRAARSVEISQLNTYQLRLEQLIIRSIRIRLKLSLTFVLYLRITLVGESSRALQSNDPHRALVFGIQKRRCHLSVVNILQTSLSEPHAGHGTDRIRHAPIDLHPHDQLLTIGAARIVNANRLATEQRHTRAKQLARTHVAVQPLTFL